MDTRSYVVFFVVELRPSVQEIHFCGQTGDRSLHVLEPALGVEPYSAHLPDDLLEEGRVNPVRVTSRLSIEVF